MNNVNLFAMHYNTMNLSGMLDVLKDEISRIRRGEISTSVDINSRFGVVIYLTGTWQINVDINVAVIIQMLHAEGFINS